MAEMAYVPILFFAMATDAPSKLFSALPVHLQVRRSVMSHDFIFK